MATGLKMKHSFQTRYRAFKIWQSLGYIPWRHKKEKTSKGGFYKGAFDSIPFLNDDAKRTFAHLLLRPGYMIRDYLNGQHERYLAPLTSLIIFYAFFALISSIVNPDFNTISSKASKYRPSTAVVPSDSTIIVTKDSTEFRITDVKLLEFLSKNKHIFNLDLHPEDVDTPIKASIAAFEGALRSQGVYLFLGSFLVLWAAMSLALRKRKVNVSAAAAISAYVLCQLCFFMLFSLFLPFGDQGKVGFWLIVILLVIDYCQLFETSIKDSLRLTIKTGVMYVLVYAALFLLLLLGVVVATFIIIK